VNGGGHGEAESGQPIQLGLVIAPVDLEANGRLAN
jgi:hypothetical protein